MTGEPSGHSVSEGDGSPVHTAADVPCGPLCPARAGRGVAGRGAVQHDGSGRPVWCSRVGASARDDARFRRSTSTLLTGAAPCSPMRQKPAAAASQTVVSCSPVPPLTPTAPTMTPSARTRAPPAKTITLPLLDAWMPWNCPPGVASSAS